LNPDRYRHRLIYPPPPSSPPHIPTTTPSLPQIQGYSSLTLETLWHVTIFVPEWFVCVWVQLVGTRDFEQVRTLLYCDNRFFFMK
jgi:hypothetical protein